MGMVFQNYAVYAQDGVPERRVRPGGQKGRPDGRPARVARVLELVNLAGLEGRYPERAERRQQQRVALARSLVVEPDILLLDEPLEPRRQAARAHALGAEGPQRRTGITFVYVTHDQSEAMALSDRIAVMHEGEIAQFGAPREVYTAGQQDRRDFMGLVNLIPGRVVRGGRREPDRGGREYPIVAALPESAVSGQAVQVAIRPESLRLTSLVPVSTADAPGWCRARWRTSPSSATSSTVTALDAHCIQIDSGQSLEVGQAVGVRFDSRRAAFAA